MRRATLMTRCMVRPRGARGFRRSGRCGLASMYPTSVWSGCAPGHHGYQRACDLISREASSRLFGSPGFARAGKTGPPLSSHPLANSAGNSVTSSIASWRCAVPLFVPGGGRSFVPTCGCRGAPRAGTVKAGRRACLASRASVARPGLDGPEHDARIKRVGRLLHWS